MTFAAWIFEVTSKMIYIRMAAISQPKMANVFRVNSSLEWRDHIIAMVIRTKGKIFMNMVSSYHPPPLIR